jgi:type VII secretion-associated serine protease mycosin
MLGSRGGRLVLAACVAGAVTLVPATAALASAAAPADIVRDSQQWVVGMLDVQPAWSVTEGAGVTVAVIDSGVDPNVTDLTGSVITGPDLTGLHTPSDSAHWGEHGTWMASIIAGHGHGSGGADGIMGVAPGARILSIRVIPDKDDPGYRAYDTEPEQTIQDSLATGIKDAVNGGAKVISMSIGYSAPSGVVRDALQYAYQHGVVLVASSGNSGQNDERRDHGFAPVAFPADYPGVISVGALNMNGTAAGFSSNNLSVQVAAPGVNVPAQGRDGRYWTVDGTSPACALVAGVAALIESRYPRISPALVLEALTTTARNSPAGSYNERTGFGAVDAAAALQAAGKLLAAHPAASQVASSARFGGGSAAVPAAPVSPRGDGKLVLFTVLAIASLALALAAGARVAAARRARGSRGYQGMAAHPAAPAAPGADYPASNGFGTGYGSGYPPGTGYAMPGTDYGAPDEHP